MDPVPYAKGAANRIEATVRAIVGQGWQVTLVTPAAPPLAGFASALRIEGLSHVVVPVESDNFLDRALDFRRQVGALVAQRPYRLAVVRSIWEGLGVLRQAPDLPLIYEAHGFPSTELSYHFSALRQHPQLVGRFIEEENTLLRRAQRVLTPSLTGARHLHSRGVPPERIRVVANSVAREDVSWHDPPPWEAPFNLLYMGTLAPWQGTEQLTEALGYLKNRFDFRLRLAGTRKGPWLRRLRHLASSLRVRRYFELLGPLARPQLRECLERSHVCLAPLPDDVRNSAQGCCPIKILEYMAAGKAIVSTRIAPVEELLEHGQSAWLVAPNSPKALADGVAYLLGNPEVARKLGENARHTSIDRFLRPLFEERVAAVLREFSAGEG